MFRRRVTLFGRSFSLAGVLLALGVVSALAGAFAFLTAAHVKVSSLNAASGTWSNISPDNCTKTAGPGSLVRCTVAGPTWAGEPDITFDNVSDATRINGTFRFTAAVTNTGPVTMALGAPSAPWVLITSPQTGMSVAPGASLDVQFVLDFSPVTPGLLNAVANLPVTWDY